ncbi:unnamed protein product [Heterobilharzia americana]|nr:unnamed protein product [Heterobilharzia americana]
MHKCCLKGEEKETFCRNGQLDVYTHRTHLQNWQCVRSTKKETVPIVCSKAVKIKYGECRPQTCRRPVFLIKSVADPNNCKCRQHQIVKEERECCCLRRSHQRLLCVGNCKVVIQQKYKFDAVNERCVKENFIRRKCPKCPSPNVLEGTCDTTGTCLKPIRHINYVIKGCQCQSVEQIRHVRCCCPAPRQLGSKCLADKGIIQNKNIYYELEKDRCIKRVKIEEKQVICPQNIEKNLSGENQFCDPNSCLQIVTTFKWSRIGCKCIKQLLTVPQVCCCTNRIAQSKKNCLPNGTIRLTIQNWKFNNGQCIKVNTVKDLPPPLCKPQEVTSLGPCDKTSGMQPILVTRSVIEECECKLVYREKRDRICACEAPTIHVKPCDRITCLQQTTTIKWALEAKDNKCHRLHPEIKMRPCCCRREIAKDSIFKKCIPTSGKTEITNRTYHFNIKREICEFKDQKKYTDLSCPTEANVIKGACNLANGIALDSITSWEKITSQCKCVQRTKYQKRICSCKHLDKTMKNPICSELHGMLVRKKTAHTLENGICLPKVIWLKKVVVCSSHKNVDKKCDPVTCNQLTTISWFDRKECKCVKKVQFIQGKCCCPKPVEYRECHQNGSLLIIKKVTYNLDEEKGICINQTDQIRKDVVCSVHGPRFIKRICDRQTCHPITILLKTVLKNCQCQRMIRKIAHPDIQCCCSEPRFQEKCDENYGIISRVTYRYELFKRQCITRKFVDQNKVACPEEKVTRGQCDVITKLRPVQRRFHTIVGCKCQVKIESKMEPCTCPLPVLVKENCTAGRISSRVWRLSYSLKRNEGSNKVACEQEKEYLFKEPCHCRPPKISKRCVGDNIIYMKQAEHLINRNDRKFCAIRHFMKKVPVTCRVNAVRVKEEQCENDLKRVTFMHETLDKKTCECKSQVKIEYEKCGCEKDNRVTESCQNGVRVTNKEIVVFSQSLGRCVKSNVRSVHPVVCATKHQVIKSSGCAIERQDGIYQSEEIRWEQVLNCKCVVKRRQILRLCACPKPSIEKQCLDTVNLVVYKNTFMHIGGQCLPNQEVVTTETRCQEKAQIVERSTCEKQPMDKSDITRPVCLETLKISVPTIVNCKCKPKIIQIQRRCCTSEPKVKQICDSVRGRWVKVIEKYVLAPGSILFKRDDLVVYDQIQKVTSEQQDQTVKTGLLTKVKTHYKRIGCECKPVKEITRGRCGCPPKRQWISECKQDFRYRRTILFKQINGTCVRQEKIGKQRCDCPKPIDRVYCDGNGRWVKCTTQYVYNSKTHVCRLLKHCVRWHDECPRPTNRIASPCNLQTQFKHLIQHVQFVKNRTSCKCDAVVKNQWMEYCKCDQLNRKVHHCRNHNTRTVGYLKYSLVKGDCVPKRMKYSQQLSKFHHKQSGILRNKCGFMEFKCPSKIYNSGPCYKGVVRKKIIVFKRTPDCICLPFVYNMLKKCPCGPPSKVLYTCSNQKQVEVESKAKKRSVHLDTSSGSKCGKNQHFVVDRNPCPETCEGKFFGVESKCSYISSGPGCQCRPGYMRDGSLCVRPSQCGCLDSVCIDREPTEKCKLWKAEGRCLKDQAIMHRVCRATCQQCERPCEDQIATSQCELIKKRGECQIDFYKSICMLTCSPHNCRCPKCHIEGGPCNPVTKNIELRHICYRLQSNGTCKPLITRRYRPCGECPTLVMRIPEKCNFCKGFVLGLRRCLMVERTHKERCSCKTISLAVKTCRDNNIPVVKTMVRVQTSCDKCMYRKINALGKRVECKKHWIKRGKCERTHLGQIGLTRKVIYARQITKNCKCQLISREEREICGCPLPKRSNPICIADKDQLAVKTTYYKPNKTHCVEYTNVSWIPKIPCPPANGKSMVGKSGQFYCNLNTCERKWTGSVWIREKCKCKSIEVTHHAGKCCCPKPEYTQSDCQNGLSDVTHINYSLVNGNCQRHIFRFTIRCNCPNSKSSVHCDAESGIKTMKTIKYEMKKDGTCKQIEIIESHRISKHVGDRLSHII